NTFAFGLMQEIRALDLASLPRDERVQAEMLLTKLSNGIDEARLGGYLVPIDQRRGPQVWLPQLASRMTIRSSDDIKNYLSRLRQVPQVIDGTIGILERAVEIGFLPPRVTLEGVEEQLVSQLEGKPEDSLFYLPLKAPPEGVEGEVLEELRREGIEVLEEVVRPAFLRLLEHFKEEYRPFARSSIACSDYPPGIDFYEHRIRVHTTTFKSAQEIHQLGLDEVARIRQEMDKVIERSGFEGDFDTFVDFLRTDERFYFDEPEELLRGYRDICKRMDAELPKLFGRLPRAPYGVREIPAFEAPRSTTAYYRPAPADGSQPGWFYANTFDLASRPRYEMVALALHEAVPGHHLQLALQTEIEGLPQFRKTMHFTAYIEGWGLYAESLGRDVGFYDDPYDDFGRLSYEMWRALRLVVDTGIHSKAWTRDEAIEYMLVNSALTRTNVEAEVDRYISWPGQALAYKIGELTIQELRRDASKRLGDSFDLRAFHDHLLAAGSLPLDVLRQRMEEWVEELIGLGHRLAGCGRDTDAIAQLRRLG
ncbi:MAG TPA: DUF885 domain-containing protein, partial [Planctomycetes bacterium]|nr:DUF885 domain-containing protein [Planctomycetota bacterium]